MIQKSSSIIRFISIIWCLFNVGVLVSSYSFSYTRVSNCVLETQSGCVYWESKLQFSKKLDALCFPEQTYLQGREGKIKISDLKVGDQILVHQQNGIAFQKVQAWLHRDAEQWFTYNLINFEIDEKTSQNNKISYQNGLYISGMHNIAIINNKTSKIDYQFANNLKQGDFLYGHGPYLSSQSPKILKISFKQQMKGIYAPYTKSGNYFVTAQKQSQHLILVHCFAHVSPKYHFLFDILITLTSFWNVQPTQSSYIHPLSSVLKQMFPSVIQTKVLNHLVGQLLNTHNYYNGASGKYSAYRYETEAATRDFKQQRKVMIIIDKILSMVQVFV